MKNERLASVPFLCSGRSVRSKTTRRFPVVICQSPTSDPGERGAIRPHALCSRGT
jgi:hypothetical protein